MRGNAIDSVEDSPRRHRRRGAALASLLSCGLMLALAGGAQGAKLCCNVFPPEPPSSEGTLGEQFALIAHQTGDQVRREGISGIAVNVEGNGPGVAPGDIYVVDKGNNRVQQLHASPDGGGHRFVRAFGLDVGGSGVNVCTLAASCQAGAASGAAGGMSEPIGIAVDETNGNLYVTDNVNHRIDVFRADGVFEGAFGWKVNATLPAEELQFCTATTGCQAGSVGGGAGQFGERSSDGVELRSIGHPAVAPAGAPDAGNVVIADSANNRVDEFSVTLNPGEEVTGVSFVAGMGWKVNSTTPLEGFQICTVASGCQAGSAGGHLGQFTDRGLTRVAVDASGAIYALNSPNVFSFCNVTNIHCHVQKINPARTEASEFAPAQLNLTAGNIQQDAASEISVDPTNGDVYVAKPHRDPEVEYQILRFDPTGNLLETYPPSGGIGVKEAAAFGLAFDYESGSLYVTSTTGGQRIVELSEQPATPPTAVTGGAAPGANFSLQTLEGTVNPNGFTVLGCRFEYDTREYKEGEAAHGTSTPCLPSSLGKGTEPVAVGAETEPLEPNTTYHYRLSAENGGLAGFGKDRTFTSAPAPEGSCLNEDRRKEQGIVALALPDCMALEMVSPPQKGGQSATLPGVSADGSRVKFLSQAALGEDPTGLIGLIGNTYVATRDESGWTIDSTVPDRGFFKIWESEPHPSFTPDFSRWLGIGANSVEVQQGIGHAYEAGLGGLFTPLSEPLVPLAFEVGSGNPPPIVVERSSFQGASADHTHLYFQPGGTGTTYLPDDPIPGGPGAERFNTYLTRTDFSGQTALELISRDHTGKVWGGRCGARLGGIGRASETSAPAPNGERNQGAISADGSRTFISARASQPQSGACEATSKLRILERLETPGDPQIEELFSSECDRVSPPCKGEGEANGDDLYQGASADQTKVYFTTNRQLADTDLDGSGEECSVKAAVAGCDLYLYDTTRPAGERLIQVSAGEELGAGIHEAGKEADVFNGITAISGDGSHVYFVAEGVLTDEESPSGEEAQAGDPNLYMWDAESEETSFLGTLDPKDAIGPTNSRGFGLWGGNGTWRNSAYPVPATAKNSEGEEVGGDGHILLFESRAELTSEDADGAHLDVYRYDSGAQPPSLECLSCKPGGPDSAPADVGDHGESAPGGTDFAEEGRWASEDGQTAGFLTSEGLLSGDVNDAPDFYLWREGSLARLPGKPFVTTADNGPFLSHDGSTTAFATQSQLLPQDGDTTADVYVARVDGGFPNPPAVTPCEPASNCQAAQTPPALSKASSEAPTAGNPPKKKPCRKNQARRNGRCVARHPRKHKSKKRHHKRDANTDRRAAR